MPQFADQGRSTSRDPGQVKARTVSRRSAQLRRFSPFPDVPGRLRRVVAPGSRRSPRGCRSRGWTSVCTVRPDWPGLSITYLALDIGSDFLYDWPDREGGLGARRAALRAGPRSPPRPRRLGRLGPAPGVRRTSSPAPRLAIPGVASPARGSRRRRSRDSPQAGGLQTVSRSFRESSHVWTSSAATSAARTVGDASEGSRAADQHATSSECVQE
jgi:hypothetical protein